MLSDILHLIFKVSAFLPSFAFAALRHRISTLIHARAYKALPPSQTKNVVVIGGSFAGYQVARRLTETLPTGYRVVLVEKNSHFNYLFVFPRFSVAKGHEQYAFIPYTEIFKKAPAGIFQQIRDTAVDVDEKAVWLKRGEKLEYEFLVVATGTSSAFPSKMASTDSLGAQEELRTMQDRVAAAEKIAVIGGGAVGVELASDIKDFYPEKKVTLFHSRSQLMPSFGKRLHDFVLARFQDLGITVLLEERPALRNGTNVLKLTNGGEMQFDLIIPCTGQRPNSSIISALSPPSTSKETSHILVKPTLQIIDDRFPRVFACGDVAATGGPKMGRAALVQCTVLVDNINSLIVRKNYLKNYRPNIFVEGSIKLTLGKTRLAIYARDDGGRETLIPLNAGKADMDVEKQWAHLFGADARTIGT